MASFIGKHKTTRCKDRCVWCVCVVCVCVLYKVFVIHLHPKEGENQNHRKAEATGGEARQDGFAHILYDKGKSCDAISFYSSFFLLFALQKRQKLDVIDCQDANERPLLCQQHTETSITIYASLPYTRQRTSLLLLQSDFSNHFEKDWLRELCRQRTVLWA